MTHMTHRITREQLIEAIQPVNGRVPTLKAVGYILGISGSYIGLLLDQEGLTKPYATRVLTGKYIPCEICGRPRYYAPSALNLNSAHHYCSPACREKGRSFSSIIPRDELIEAIKPVNGHQPTLQEIGDRYGVTREAVRLRLVKEGLVKRPSRRGKPSPNPRCPVCDRPIREGREHCFHGEGKPKAARVVLTCGNCGTVFERRFAEYQNGLRPKHTRKTVERVTPFFCGDSCSGSWKGKHYGFGKRAAATSKERPSWKR